MKKSLPKNVLLNPNSRRMFLRSAGGLTLSLPFLPSLATLVLSEKALSDQVNPIRYVGVRTPHGGLQYKNWVGPNLPTQNFELYPGQNARLGLISSLKGADGLSPIFNSSFQNMFPYMNIILGADVPSYLGHSWFSGSGAFPASGSDQKSLTGIIGENCSVDQVMAHYNKNGVYGTQISGRTRYINLHGGTESYGRDIYDSLSLSVKNKETVDGFAGAFQTLFGSIAPTNVVTATPTENPLLNLVNEFWNSGKTLIQKLSIADRQSLDQFFQLAQQASQDYATPATQGSLQCSSTRPASNGNVLSDYADLIAMAFKCDLTRVVTINGAQELSGLNWHDIAHSATDANDINAGQSELIQLIGNVAQKFILRLGNNLNVADPFNSSQSILTNSIIKWSHENKCSHETYSLPVMMLGGGGGRLNTGYVADLRNMAKPKFETDQTGDPQIQGDLINRLYASLFYAMDVPKSAYEVQRGGGSVSLSLNKGFGHVLNETAGWYNGAKSQTYNLSKIGEPWEFLRKSSVVWG